MSIHCVSGRVSETGATPIKLALNFVASKFVSVSECNIAHEQYLKEKMRMKILGLCMCIFTLSAVTQN